MQYWETALEQPDTPAVEQEYARIWQAADKVVYSATLTAPVTARTRLERTFDADAVRRLKTETEADLSIGGSDLAAQALEAGLVDELEAFVAPVVVGGGRRFLPDGLRTDLELIDEHRFDSGFVSLRYAVRG